VLRRLMSALRPPVLDNRGFAEALREHAQRFEEDTGITVDLDLGLADRLPPELETVLYRIAQESLPTWPSTPRPGGCRWPSTSRPTPWPGYGSATTRRLRRHQPGPAAPGGPLRPGRDAGAGQPGRRDHGGRLPARARHDRGGPAADRGGHGRAVVDRVDGRQVRIGGRWPTSPPATISASTSTRRSWPASPSSWPAGAPTPAGHGPWPALRCTGGSRPRSPSCSGPRTCSPSPP
jgi:hypothetical protein